MKNVIITGGSKGLGKEIKRKLQQGKNYIIEDWSRSTGHDITKGFYLPNLQSCDILILNAGTWKNDWRLNYEIPKAMAESMDKETNPREKLVIFILSNAAYQSFGNDDYTAAKSGLLHYARRKQREGYNFSTISPGTINTGFWDEAEVDNRKKGAMRPEVVAELVYQSIKAFENGALIKEMILTPC